MAVSSTQDYPLPDADGTVCDGCPSVLLEQCKNIMDTTCKFFQEMWRITGMDDCRKVRDSVLAPRIGCLQAAKGYLEMIKEGLIKTSEME
jgi:hypothetical protein